jgi:large subunit ribosomal protein L9
MADMFERDEAGFTEDYDPNAEPGTIDAPAATAESTGGEGEAASA